MNAWLTALIALQILDALTTYKALKLGAREGNLLLVLLAEKLRSVTNAKWAWLVIAKLFAAACCIWLAHHSVIASAAVVAIYVAVVVNNLLLIKRLWRHH